VDVADVGQSCQVDLSASQVADTQSYSNNLKASVSTSGDFWLSSFAASVDYTKTQEETSSNFNIFMSTTAQCIVYRALLQNNLPFNLTQNFRNLIASMPPEADFNPLWFAVVEQFGSHYPQALSMGASFAMTYRLSQQSFQSMAVSALDVSATASLFSKFKISGSSNFTNNQTETFSQKVEHTSISSFGTPPPKSLDALEWANNVRDQVVPVGMKLSSLADFLTSKYFLNDPAIYNKSIAFQKAVDQYCPYLVTQGSATVCEPQSRLQCGMGLSGFVNYAFDWSENPPGVQIADVGDFDHAPYTSIAISGVTWSTSYNWGNGYLALSLASGISQKQYYPAYRLMGGFTNISGLVTGSPPDYVDREWGQATSAVWNLYRGLTWNQLSQAWGAGLVQVYVQAFDDAQCQNQDDSGLIVGFEYAASTCDSQGLFITQAQDFVPYYFDKYAKQGFIRKQFIAAGMCYSTEYGWGYCYYYLYLVDRTAKVMDVGQLISPQLLASPNISQNWCPCGGSC
jgi:hypothetical protein